MYSDSTRTIQSARPSSHSPPETEGTQSEPMQVYNGGRSLLQVLVVDSREVHKGRVVVTLGVTHVFFQHVFLLLVLQELIVGEKMSVWRPLLTARLTKVRQRDSRRSASGSADRRVQASSYPK